VIKPTGIRPLVSGKAGVFTNVYNALTATHPSPYLSAGVISCREVVRATMDLLKIKHVQSSRDTSVGMWVQEIGARPPLPHFSLCLQSYFTAWRDFYTHVMCAWPRVSMGRPYQEKYADIKWESNEEHFNAWKEGKTGVPIVDAGMRQLNTMGEAASLVFRFEMLNFDGVELRLDAQPRTDGRCHVFDEGSYAGLASGGKGS